MEDQMKLFLKDAELLKKESGGIINMFKTG
jgi:hypothetical protein